jgi:DNA-3-methyladenine glycosylase
LGITKSQNAESVLGLEIWIDNPGITVGSIVETTRIGIDYAKEDANLLWRFYKQDSKYISIR